MRILWFMTCLFLVIMPAAEVAFSQQPSVDLAITDIAYTCLPGDSALIEAEVQLATIDTTDAIVTEVQFAIDGNIVGTVVYDAEGKLPDPCELLTPPCNTAAHVCSPIIINGQVVQPDCWELIILDPPADVCSCVYLVIKAAVVLVPGEPTLCTATVDPNNQVAEFDEDNNSMTVAVGPSLRESTVWGTIKALYK